ncbi:MAG TPA: efflux RND transporter periplasmic adaptor subunit, partial [Candidatus Polarisedimenticolia bacterium]|nr:efflux RND transporter periplasmic adaptor subunit [Candidatus Polarisedimenticolia bacterium]
AGDANEATARVEREDFRTEVEATGTLEAAVAFEVGPPSVQDFWEYNLSWMIPEGSRVKKGDVIARFDATQLEERLREHNAARETAVQEKEKEERNLEVTLRQLDLDLVKAQGELKKIDIEVAVPDSLLSSVEVQQTRLRKELAERRVSFLSEKIEFQKALVKSKLDLLDVKREFAEGKIAYTEDAIDRFNVRAPVTGLVIYIPKRNGDRWEVGEGVWMLAKLMKVADVSTLRVEANVLEVDSATIAVGQQADIAVDALPGLKLRSRIAEIGRIVHERSVQDPSKVFDAIMPLEGANTEMLRPGMGVHVRVETRVLPGSLTVPLEAVHIAEEGPYVDLVGRGGRTQRRMVTLGPRNRQRVVVEQGLEAGDVVSLTAGSTGRADAVQG